MFIGGEEVVSPTGTTLSPTSVPNGKKIAGVGSARQFTKTASSNNTTAVDMFCTTTFVYAIHCIVSCHSCVCTIRKP